MDEHIGVIAGCALVGLLAGAGANVAIHRVPSVAVAWPPPPPGFRIAVLALLRPGSRRGATAHALVELAVAAAFAAVGARIGWDWALPAFLLFTWTLLVVSVIDANIRKIPNRLTYPLTPALALLLLLAALLAGEPWWGIRALIAGVLAFGALLLLAVARPGGMGMGDVKLAAFIGLGLGYLGWSYVVLGVVAAFLLGGMVALVLVVLRARARTDALPFGPYLAAGALLAVLAGGPVIDGYASLVVTVALP